MDPSKPDAAAAAAAAAAEAEANAARRRRMFATQTATWAQRQQQHAANPLPAEAMRLYEQAKEQARLRAGLLFDQQLTSFDWYRAHRAAVEAHSRRMEDRLAFKKRDPKAFHAGKAAREAALNQFARAVEDHDDDVARRRVAAMEQAARAVPLLGGSFVDEYRRAAQANESPRWPMAAAAASPPARVAAAAASPPARVAAAAASPPARVTSTPTQAAAAAARAAAFGEAAAAAAAAFARVASPPAAPAAAAAAAAASPTQAAATAPRIAPADDLADVAARLKAERDEERAMFARMSDTAKANAQERAAYAARVAAATRAANDEKARIQRLQHHSSAANRHTKKRPGEDETKKQKKKKKNDFKQEADEEEEEEEEDEEEEDEEEEEEEEVIVKRSKRARRIYDDDDDDELVAAAATTAATATTPTIAVAAAAANTPVAVTSTMSVLIERQRLLMQNTFMLAPITSSYMVTFQSDFERMSSDYGARVRVRCVVSIAFKSLEHFLWEQFSDPTFAVKNPERATKLAFNNSNHNISDDWVLVRGTTRIHGAGGYKRHIGGTFLELLSGRETKVAPRTQGEALLAQVPVAAAALLVPATCNHARSTCSATRPDAPWREWRWSCRECGASGTGCCRLTLEADERRRSFFQEDGRQVGVVEALETEAKSRDTASK